LVRICEELASRPEIRFKVVSSRFKGLNRLPNVKAYQGIDDGALLRLYRKSDLLLLPMRYATANNALLEGIACGLPVVSNDLPGLRAYVPGTEALLIKGASVDDFAGAVMKVAHDPQRRRRMAAAARRRALELDWRKVAPLFEDVYDELVHGI
jgi:glycosyltransferase involved in cell wall biosynthesis